MGAKRMPEPGDLVRILGDGPHEEHIATVQDCLSTQFTCSYEVARNDGGWTEVTHFFFYVDKGGEWQFE